MLDKEGKQPIMMCPKTTFVTVFLCGMAVALLATLLPNLNWFSENTKYLTSDTSLGIKIDADFKSSFVRCSEKVPSSVRIDLQGEALASITLAREMISMGKIEKAFKLYKHALALDETYSDALNEYGEFLEKYEKDILKAEHMYCKALTYSPTHTKALENRQRTLPLVEEIDQNYFNRIDKKRDHLFKTPDNHPGMRRMKKESYYQNIYHTSAIEGNTFTLSQTRALIETRMAIGGKSIFEHNEILGMDSALSFINSTLIRRIGPLTIEDILDIHQRVLGFVDPVDAGKFRNTQVFVGDFVPPAASQVAELMDEFVEWLNSDEALKLHPIEHAALAHYKFVIIHPFYDGNGRTARLLMNLILMRSGFPPVIIKVEEKHQYYQFIETGNNGDIRPFIRFIAKCTDRTLDQYLWATSDMSNSTFRGLVNVPDDGRTIILEDEKDVIQNGSG